MMKNDDMRCVCVCVGVLKKNNWKSLFDWVCERFENGAKQYFWNKTVHFEKSNGFIHEMVGRFESSKK